MSGAVTTFLVGAAALGAWAVFSSTSRRMWFASGVATELQHEFGFPSNIADSIVAQHREVIEQQRKAGNTKQIVASALASIYTSTKG